jgi:hypothetical protein
MGVTIVPNKVSGSTVVEISVDDLMPVQPMTSVRASASGPRSEKSTTHSKGDKRELNYCARGLERSSPVEDGLAIGFIAGSCLSIVGIPILAVEWAEAEGKISKNACKSIKQALIPFTFPGLLVGLAVGVVGAGVGGMVSLCRKIHHACKKHRHCV